MEKKERHNEGGDSIKHAQLMEEIILNNKGTSSANSNTPVLRMERDTDAAFFDQLNLI